MTRSADKRTRSLLQSPRELLRTLDMRRRAPKVRVLCHVALDRGIDDVAETGNEILYGRLIVFGRQIGYAYADVVTFSPKRKLVIREIGDSTARDRCPRPSAVPVLSSRALRRR